MHTPLEMGYSQQFLQIKIYKNGAKFGVFCLTGFIKEIFHMMCASITMKILVPLLSNCCMAGMFV